MAEIGQLEHAAIGGAGLGATISLRAAVAHSDRVSGLVLISVEDIEDDAGKAAETAFMDAFAERVRTKGIAAGWDPILPSLSPIVGVMVREALLDADATSVAAAAAIGHDRARFGASMNCSESRFRRCCLPAPTGATPLPWRTS